jgi:hypothetical protein
LTLFRVVSINPLMPPTERRRHARETVPSSAAGAR